MLIQGGMGVGVSNWVLARAVALTGQMGVVSGTALDSLLVRRLQDGDPGGHVRRAMEHFPIPEVCERVLNRYFLPDGRKAGASYALAPMYKQAVSRVRDQLTVLGGFVEVYLAREGHSGPVGMNLLTKVQMPNLATIYGAMLAGVDYILMGAGIPREIPGVLDAFAEQRPATMRLEVEGGGKGEPVSMSFDPTEHWPVEMPASLKRPYFLPIIASNLLATMLARKANGRVDGFIIEAPIAGGHNAPPRASGQFNERGEPLYGDRDVVDLDGVAELGLPFWLAGGTGSPERLREALDAGATGIQVGTLFAYSDESGIREDVRRQVLEQARNGGLDVHTNATASPTGFPFKVVNLEGSIADEEVYESRERICDLGYLRVAYRDEKGKVGYRCPAEPVDVYVAKGGNVEDTVGRRCLCNALMADIGHAQERDGYLEPTLITSGDDLKNIHRFAQGRTGFSAAEVVSYLMKGAEARA
jgi:nitronate monooxygenase